jgi:aryl-alcohol dehydrogenase-like predicted oxidoreductase
VETLEETADDIVAVLAGLQDQGKIRAFGNSLNATEDGSVSINKYGFRSIQVNINIFDQRAIDSGLLNLAGEMDVGVIARTPLSFGFLTNGCSGQDKFDKFDHRSKWSKEQLQRWDEGNNDFAGVFGKYEEQTRAQVALRYCLSLPGVSTVIPGMLKVSEVEENAAASDMGPLEAETMRRIAEIYSENEFYIQP